MSEVVNISNISITQPIARETSRGTTSERTSKSPIEDSVEISDVGFALMRAAEESSLRIAKTRAIRAEISAGAYETPERIEGTITRLLDILG